MNITTNSASTIGRNFLKGYDKILQNWQALRCADIAEFYFGFFEGLKEFKGNSHGFTGLSEYLIFRFLYHLLGGSFRREWITKHVAEFVSKSDSGLRLRQNLALLVNGKKKYPDVAVYEGGVLKAIIQIKIYLTRGRNEIVSEMKTLKEIKAEYPEMKAVLAIFDSLSEKGTCLPELEKQRKENADWFDYVVLRHNCELLGQKLSRCLGL